jgi:hypothetical protein
MRVGDRDSQSASAADLVVEVISQAAAVSMTPPRAVDGFR